MWQYILYTVYQESFTEENMREFHNSQWIREYFVAYFFNLEKFYKMQLLILKCSHEV